MKVPQIFLFLTGSFFMWNCESVSVSGELFLPEGFESTVFIDSIPETVRHIAVDATGKVYAKFNKPSDRGVLIALKDVTNDGVADSIIPFGNYSAPQKGGYSTAARIYEGYLYFSSRLAVYRYKLNADTMIPAGPLETVVLDDHSHGSHEHIAKPIAFDNDGNLYVPFGAPSNACQEPKRTPFQAGLNPCPQLIDHAGIWKFDAHQLNQTQADGERYATGIRSLVAMDWNMQENCLFAVVHGRDDLLRLWPDRYSAWQSAVLPSEEFIRIEKGDDFGWPYCYYDQIQEKKVLAPEYGGDGEKIGACGTYKNPIMGFPGHWAPNDLVFYDGEHFPEHYKNGAFIAFHGATNRAPYPQAGYFVGFVPFQNGWPTGEWEIFADGFAKVDTIVNVNDAIYRPMGIAFGKDGSMYIGDTEKGRIWRILYRGKRDQFGAKHRAAMELRKNLPHIKNPDIIKDKILVKNNQEVGEQAYTLYCAICHQGNGKGASGRFPPLANTDWVSGDKERLIKIILQGMEGSIEVNNETYNGIMPQHAFLDDSSIAEILTYIRSHFGNQAAPITEEEIARVRKINIHNSDNTK